MAEARFKRGKSQFPTTTLHQPLLCILVPKPCAEIVNPADLVLAFLKLQLLMSPRGTKIAIFMYLTDSTNTAADSSHPSGRNCNGSEKKWDFHLFQCHPQSPIHWKQPARRRKDKVSPFSRKGGCPILESLLQSAEEVGLGCTQTSLPRSTGALLSPKLCVPPPRKRTQHTYPLHNTALTCPSPSPQASGRLLTSQSWSYFRVPSMLILSCLLLICTVLIRGYGCGEEVVIILVLWVCGQLKLFRFATSITYGVPAKHVASHSGREDRPLSLWTHSKGLGKCQRRCTQFQVHGVRVSCSKVITQLSSSSPTAGWRAHHICTAALVLESWPLVGINFSWIGAFHFENTSWWDFIFLWSTTSCVVVFILCVFSCLSHITGANFHETWDLVIHVCITVLFLPVSCDSKLNATNL